MLKLPASMLRSLQEKAAREGRPAQALVLELLEERRS